jgi:hypothetical protein
MSVLEREGCPSMSAPHMRCTDAHKRENMPTTRTQQMCNACRLKTLVIDVKISDPNLVSSFNKFVTV